MKIETIEFHNHPIVENLKIDFRHKDKNVVDTVIVAGENGTGKTTILKSIFYALRFTPLQKKEGLNWGELKLICKTTEQEMKPFFIFNHTKTVLNTYNIKNESHLKNSIELRLNYSITGNWECYKCTLFRKDGATIKIPPNYFSSAKELIGLFKGVFSTAEINYSPREIKHTTTLKVDEKDLRSFISKDDIATKITQLLIDVRVSDNEEFMRNYAEISHPDKIPKFGRRLMRFKNAFEFMFSDLEFEGIDTENTDNGIKVIFKRNGKTIPIDNLSSGEKQIVFRGSFLLQNQKTIEGAVILIDEPEISLHPKWQMKILDFYKKLFTNEKGEQTSQIIVVTHSPFIIHNDSRSKDKVIILKRDESGKIFSDNNPKYFSWTSEKIIKEAFNIELNFDPTKLIVFVEGKTDEKYIKKALNILGKEHLPVQVEWIGRVNERGGEEFTGDKSLNQARNMILAQEQVLQSSFLLLYDSDTRKPDENKNKLFVRTMSKIDENTLYKIGVENLLVLPSNFVPESFYSIHKKVDDYGVENEIKSLNKNRLCDTICDTLPLEQQKEYLANFTKIFDTFEEVLAKAGISIPTVRAIS